MGRAYEPELLPGMIFAGSFAVPLSIVVLFMETNTPRNISVSQVIFTFLTGAVISFFIALILFEVYEDADLQWMRASVAGLAEEPAKVLALVVLAYNRRYRYTLNGLLFGAAVGAGFAAFESAGYAFCTGLNDMIHPPADTEPLKAFAQAMEDNLMLRGLLAPFGHVVWTAMCGGMLWKVKGSERFRWSMLLDSRFLRVLGIAVALHMLYNSEFIGELQLGFMIVLGLVAWLVVFAILADGLKQIEDEKAAASQCQPAAVAQSDGLEAATASVETSEATA